MFFPYGDDRIHGGSYPLLSYGFLAFNVLIFFYQSSLSVEELEVFFQHYSCIPAYIQEGHHLSTLFTSMFLHGSLMHLLGNMLFLWVFADNIEATIGHGRFLLFYLGGGVVASLVHVYVNVDSTVPTLGASGAISAVLGAYLVMFPHSRIKVLVFLIFILRQITVPALLFLGIWIVIQIGSAYQSTYEDLEGGGTAWFAHLGGLVFGVVMGFVFRPLVQLITVERAS